MLATRNVELIKSDLLELISKVEDEYKRESEIEFRMGHELEAQTALVKSLRDALADLNDAKKNLDDF